MSTINQLLTTDGLSLGDLLVVYASSNSDARKASLSTLVNFLNSQLTSTDDKITQYSAPSATGFTVILNDANTSLWLVLTPGAGYAAGTLKLPNVANCIDKQEILVNCTQAVTTLTIDANGATVTGAPAVLTANGFFRLRFEGVTKTWYRVG